jgi:hypothetical protein
MYLWQNTAAPQSVRRSPMRRSILVTAVLLLSSVGLVGAQDKVELVSPTDQIPRDSFKTWSLFLICNPDWAMPEKSADLANLYHRFQAFGDAIGRNNLAVWFWKRPLPIRDPKLAENVDVARSAEFCRALGKPPSQGPYLVITEAYPDIAAFPKERAILEMGNLPPAKLASALNGMTDQLLLQGRVDAMVAASTSSTAPAPEPPNLWIRLLQGARQSLIGLGCAVKLQIDTGVFNAELRACTG